MDSRGTTSVRLVAVLAAAALSACATTQVQTAAQLNEKAMIEADDLYIAVATSINAYEVLPGTTAAQKANVEAIKLKAWNDLQIVRAAYAAGQAVTTAALQADTANAAAAGVAPAS